VILPVYLAGKISLNLERDSPPLSVGREMDIRFRKKEYVKQVLNLKNNK